VRSAAGHEPEQVAAALDAEAVSARLARWARGSRTGGEEQEAAVPGTGGAEESAQPAGDEGPPPELEEVIDAAAAPAQDKDTQSRKPG
jgi:hypothetical protein